jgi:LmbE family N-acetylglucosaminyl deacetylase
MTPEGLAEGEPPVSDPLRIVSIGAHPADVFDQSGGTMAHHTARGD